MPRQILYLDQSVIDRLKKYTKNKYGNRRVLSVTAQVAIVKFLDEEEGKSGKKKQSAASRVKII